jgi:hypothetical protein
MNLVITIVLLGLLASVSPSTIVVFILLLATTRARLNAAAFLTGWSVSLLIVFAVCYAVGGARITQHGSGSTAVKVIEILLGAALAVVAARQWRHRDRVPPEYSIVGLTCSFGCGPDAVMVGCSGASEDRLPADALAVRPGCADVPRGPGEGRRVAGAPA